jgi:hypothetical protein
MSDRIIIETIGTIEKKEMLGPVGYSQLVLESFHPYPGYHGTTIPDSDRPKSLFIITRSKYTEEKIIRATLKIKNEKNFTYDGTPGMVTLYNMLNPCIRLKDVAQYEDVPLILKAYEDEGIEFMSNRKIEPFSGIIKVKKYFLIEQLTPTTFVDAEDPKVHYFNIPCQLRWPQFEKMTLDIKRNLEDPDFDAALGTIYRKTGLIDIIRIYDDHCTPERLDMIMGRYLDAISRNTQ